MLKIIFDPEPVLRMKATEVSLPLSKEDHSTLLWMLDYLKKSQDEEYAKTHNLREGVGLAAPQLGISKRMFVLYYQKENTQIAYALVNPVVISTSLKEVCLSSGEGCLSVNEDYPGYVYRPSKTKFKAFDALTNQEVELTFRDFDSIVFNHELDHLNGVLFYDRINQKDPFFIKDNGEIL